MPQSTTVVSVQKGKHGHGYFRRDSAGLDHRARRERRNIWVRRARASAAVRGPEAMAVAVNEIDGVRGVRAKHRCPQLASPKIGEADLLAHFVVGLDVRGYLGVELGLAGYAREKVVDPLGPKAGVAEGLWKE